MGNSMHMHYIAGINSDRIQVTIENQTNRVFSQEYAFGYNISSSRENAEYSRKDHEDAIKYGWTTAHPFMPFIGDVLNELKENFQIDEQDIVFTGHNVFTGNDFDSAEIKQLSNHFKKLLFDF